MPIYEYQCEACGHQFDLLQRIGEATPRECPQCGRPKVQRTLSTPSFQLRGSGWRKRPAKDPGNVTRTMRRIGHTLDSGPAHSHDDRDDHGHGHGSEPGHRHRHGHGH